MNETLPPLVLKNEAMVDLTSPVLELLQLKPLFVAVVAARRNETRLSTISELSSYNGVILVRTECNRMFALIVNAETTKWLNKSDITDKEHAATSDFVHQQLRFMSLS